MTAALRVVQGNPELQDRAELWVSGEHTLALVADGVGGMAGGREAAEQVAAAARRDPPDSARACRLLLSRVDRDLARVGQSTAVLVGITGQQLWGAGVGDSGAWLIAAAGHRNLTQYCRKPYLGSGEADPVEFQCLWRDETLLVASDGLIRYTDPARIVKAALLADLEEAAEALLKLVRLPLSGEYADDTSLILVRRA